jgi:hypothetical protein
MGSSSLRGPLRRLMPDGDPFNSIHWVIHMFECCCARVRVVLDWMNEQSLSIARLVISRV